MDEVEIQCSQVRDEVTKREVVEFLNRHFLPHEPMNISIKLLEPGYRCGQMTWHIFTFISRCIRVPRVPGCLTATVQNPLL